MKKLIFSVGFLLFFLPAWGSAESLQWTLKGLKGSLAKNANLYLEALPDINRASFPGLRPRIREEVQFSLQALGYYQPSITVHPLAAEDDTFVIDVEAGPPTYVRKLSVVLLGDAQSDSAFEALLKKLPLATGDVLNDEKYEAIKSTLSNLAASRGYFDAQFSQHRVKVYPEEHAADVTIIFDAGVRYRFGITQYGKMSVPTQQLLETMVPISPGDLYDSVVLGRLNQDISSTGYFRQIDIHTVKSAIDDYQVPVFIGVKPRLKHELEVGAGYSTDDGPRFSLSWDKPWINDYGHSLTNQLAVSGKTQELTSSYKIPDGNPLQDFYNLQLGYQRTIQEDTSSSLVSTSVHRWFKRSVDNPENWDQDVFFRVDYEDYTQGEQTDNSLLLIPGLSLSRRRAKGGTDPYWGDQQLAKIELSSKQWGSDTDFVKIWGRSKWLRTFYKKHRIITRVEQGAIWVNDISNIPASLRFFTGGDQSIRGFAYESISPRDSEDKLAGARYATVGSFEYAYSILPKWRVATFVDTGTATNDYKDKWSTGAGVGLRWVTPLGQIKLDLAFAVSEKGSPWRIHFSMGPEI